MRIEYCTSLSFVSMVLFPSFHLIQNVLHVPFLIRFRVIAKLPRQNNRGYFGIGGMLPQRMTAFASTWEFHKACLLQLCDQLPNLSWHDGVFGSFCVLVSISPFFVSRPAVEEEGIESRTFYSKRFGLVDSPAWVRGGDAGNRILLSLRVQELPGEGGGQSGLANLGIGGRDGVFDGTFFTQQKQAGLRTGHGGIEEVAI